MLSIGMVAWSIGGGHGPLNPASGLGVDNILEVDIVTADGNLITVNADNEYSDLFWALKGGGASNWGVITAITIKAHYIPTGGFTDLNIIWSENFCSENFTNLTNFLDHYAQWTLGLN